MNEASSKFVDTLALEKLLNEKLSKVRHSIRNSVFVSQDISLEDIDMLSLDLSQVRCINNENGLRCFTLPSFFKSMHYKENNMIYLHYHPANTSERNILLIHGLFDDNINNYNFLIKLLNESNINVFFMELPYHFSRKPEISTFSGEYFLSADVYRSRNAFKQAIYDIEASMQFINSCNTLPTSITGFSMGGCIAFRYHLLKKQAVKTFLINPVTDLTNLVWDNPLLVYVKQDILDSGFEMSKYERIYKELDPCYNLHLGFNEDKVAMVYSIYDQIINENKYKTYIRKIGFENVQPYSSGHLNILRVPKLSRDINDFINRTKIENNRKSPDTDISTNLSKQKYSGDRYSETAI